jgi:Spy/CpxP family protein refolding chaperone
MKQIKIILILLIAASSLFAQQAPPGPGMKRIHAAKMAYITDRLQLSQEQSSGFIPLYNNYERDLRTIRQSFFRKYKDNHGSEEQDEMMARQYIEDDLDYQQQVIELKRKYNDSFLKILTPIQLAELYKAEREFRQMLIQQVRQRRGNGRWR